jgi:hypothetical protein
MGVSSAEELPDWGILNNSVEAAAKEFADSANKEENES